MSNKNISYLYSSMNCIDAYIMIVYIITKLKEILEFEG